MEEETKVKRNATNGILWQGKKWYYQQLKRFSLVIISNENKIKMSRPKIWLFFAKFINFLVKTFEWKKWEHFHRVKVENQFDRIKRRKKRHIATMGLGNSFGNFPNEKYFDDVGTTEKKCGQWSYYMKLRQIICKMTAKILRLSHSSKQAQKKSATSQKKTSRKRTHGLAYFDPRPYDERCLYHIHIHKFHKSLSFFSLSSL